MWFMNGVKPHKHLSPLALKGRLEQTHMRTNQHGEQTNMTITQMRWF